MADPAQQILPEAVRGRAPGAIEARASIAAEHGFTLIEIIFAILILAGSLVVLLGLQSAATQATIRDGRKLSAMLAARAVMSAIELGDPEIEVQDTTAPMNELMELVIPGATDKEPDPQTDPRGPAPGLTGRLVVEYWPLPGVEPETVKRVSLTVSWSDSPIDAVKALYFIPAGEAAAAEDLGEDE